MPTNLTNNLMPFPTKVASFESVSLDAVASDSKSAESDSQADELDFFKPEFDSQNAMLDSGNDELDSYNAQFAVLMDHSSIESKGPSKRFKRSLRQRLKYFIPRFKLCLVQEGKKSREVFTIRTPLDAIDFLEPLRLASEEHFVALHLNVRHEVIGLHEISHGTVSTSLVHPREVFKAAILANSSAIIVCHNHPSGSYLWPSPDDMTTTAQLIKGANILGLTLLDHLIVDRNDETYSIRENHPELWEEPK
ncbi:MAG: JAB domain-containing protein [Candidatus Obscuribacterales bacterium]|jgi:DNA repair protein RadC|nr:JAB domain-containing protein [Candidatus Obscuribacterales bacterium]